MAGLLYEVEGQQVLNDIKRAIASGRPDAMIALHQECSAQDIRSIRACLRDGAPQRLEGALSTARAIYGLRSERRQKFPAWPAV